MTAIESEFEPLVGVLPKDYGIFETKVLEDPHATVQQHREAVPARDPPLPHPETLPNE